LKRLIAAFLCLIICLGICGCNLYTVDTDNLLSPPKLNGDMYPIQVAIENSLSGGYKLKYPSVGNYRSAVILEDLDGDKKDEAIAFYETSNDEQVTMNINIIRLDGKKAKSVDSKSFTAAGINMVDFCDLDNDGTKEILVGWEIYANSEKQLTVYSFSSDTLISRFEQKYTNFICCDLDSDKKSELLIQLLDTKSAVNKAGLFSISKEGVKQTSGCIMDSAVKTAGEFKISTLSTGQTAVYVDEIKGIGAVTEVLFVTKGELVNTLLDVENNSENNRTLRAANISSSDINGDGIIEIPIASDMPRADANSGENIYYTNWCSFNGEALTVKQVSIINSVDGYKIEIPRQWLNSIAVAKDTDKKTRTIYNYDVNTQTVGEKIVTFKVYTKSEWNKAKGPKTVKLGAKGDNIYAFIKGDNKGQNSLSTKEIKKIFSFYYY